MRVGRQRQPWPVSKYMTLSPTVPRFSASAASCASRSSARIDAEARDWRPRCRRSTGTPDRPARPAPISSIVVVTWASTQALRRDLEAARSARRASTAGRDARCRAVGRRIDADHRIARAVQQPVERSTPRCRRDRRSDGSAAAAPTGGRAGRCVLRNARHDAALARDQHQILVAHHLARPPRPSPA